MERETRWGGREVWDKRELKKNRNRQLLKPIAEDHIRWTLYSTNINITVEYNVLFSSPKNYSEQIDFKLISGIQATMLYVLHKPHWQRH